MQIQPWLIADRYYGSYLGGPTDPRSSVFVGGVPRNIRAFTLAKAMSKTYGQVCFVDIECDPAFKFPKGKPTD